VNDVREAYQRQLAQAERASNGGLDEARRGAIKQHVLDDYVSGESLLTRVEALGYRVSDADLLKAMAQIPAFQVDGKFDQGMRGRGAQGAGPLRGRGRRADPPPGASSNSSMPPCATPSFATDAKLKRLRALTRQQRDLAWVTVPAAQVAADAVPDEAAIKAYYDRTSPNT
jgi:peptidyl-prolyl cis-trans isomerase D